MAWLDEDVCYTWDQDYPTWREAFTKCAELATLYKMHMQATEREPGRWICLTYDDIGTDEPHSVACRCASCWQ